MVLARGLKVVEVRGYGMRIHEGNSTAMEWMAKPVFLSLTDQLTGKKILVADSAAGAFQGEKLPDFGTWLTTLCKKAVRGTDLECYFEGWVRAQHDSRAKEFLALCNKLADAKATEYLKQSQPREFFPTSGQGPGTVFHIKGDVVLCLSASMDKVYADLMVEKARMGVAGWDARWHR